MFIFTSNSLHFPLLLFTCLFLLLVQNPIQAQIFLSCNSLSNYTSGSQFETNLKNILFPSLISNGAINGFFNTSSGNNPDTVYGLIQCRGDISMDDCKTCLNTSTVQIIQKCPNKKDAAIRFDYCLVRYSNLNFFTQVDTSAGSLWNTQNATDPAVFNSQLGNLMSNISSIAASIPSKFATRSIRYNDFGNIYGMVQCTQDLSTSSCSSCLQTMISKIPSCCSGKIGGQVFSKSCAIRFENNIFYQLLSPPPPSPPPPPPTVEGSSPPQPPSGVTGNGKGSSPNIVAIVVPIIIGVLLLLTVFGYFLMKKGRRMRSRSGIIDGDGITSEESLQFDLVTIRIATKEFSDANKLGEGGFGAVYKGQLLDGQEIAVKRLASNSEQGSQEFKNEVVLLHKLQHRNLVRLLGFCLEGEEKILIYEYLPNRSLDKYLFDPTRKRLLDWDKRYKIIGGIARGLLYLHEDSRLRIIHRDLKPGNILLDEEMNAKIADFGMAKLFRVDQTRDNTSRIAGTFGYMAPEYALHGLFSVKSDVFSFGVLILEIVTGQKITSFYQSASSQDLLSYAWKHWREGKDLELMDSTLGDSFSSNEVMRCIHIGLLCIQENIDDRPTMSAVVLMLNSYSLTLAPPSKPAFFAGSRIESNNARTDHSKGSSISYK